MKYAATPALSHLDAETSIAPPLGDHRRHDQLSALAADPNQDAAECARADLFHELTSDWAPYLLGAVPVAAAHDS
jgi:hypothetical protein